MKVLEFKYTKANGKVSDRTVVQLVAPTKHIEGIDVTELDIDTYADFVKELNDLERDIHEKRNKLYAKYDLTHNYRRFIPDNMHDVTNEYM